jgi:hypothetical protein
METVGIATRKMTTMPRIGIEQTTTVQRYCRLAFGLVYASPAHICHARPPCH